MKIVITLLLVLLVFSGCEEDPISPYDEGADDVYGSSIVKIPGLASSKTALSNEKYTFTLGISGANMRPLDFKWQLDESGASFKIDRIPAGRSRLFKGVLYGTDGSIYEGSATVDIYGGKVAHVRLVLTRTGGANVEVIFDEGIVESGLFAGCWKLRGIVNGIDLSKSTLDIPEYKGKNFYGYIKEGDKNVGKFEGKEENGEFTIDLHLRSSYNVSAHLKGVIASSAGQFKSIVYSLDGSSKIGLLGGVSIECKKEVPPPPLPPLPLPGLLIGCWNLIGFVKDIDISKFNLEIPQYNVSFGGYVKEGDKRIGKFSGTEQNGKIKANFYLPSPYNTDAQFTGSVSSTGNDFKGAMVPSDGSSQTYMIEGHEIICSAHSPNHPL